MADEQRTTEHGDQAVRRNMTPIARIQQDRAPRQRMATSPGEPQPPVAGTAATSALSRRAALKAGAAGLAFMLTLGHVTPAIAADLTRLAQGRPMTGARLAAILRTERAVWHALLAQVGPARMDDAGVEGTWSVKQLVAHLTWYEGRVVAGARQVLGTGSYVAVRDGLAALEMDERNERIAAETRSRPTADVLAEAEQVFKQLLTVIEACPAHLLNDATGLGLPDDIVPWMLVANNSYAHYRQHAEAVQAWLERHPRRDA